MKHLLRGCSIQNDTFVSYLYIVIVADIEYRPYKGQNDGAYGEKDKGDDQDRTTQIW